MNETYPIILFDKLFFFSIRNANIHCRMHSFIDRGWWNMKVDVIFLWSLIFFFFSSFRSRINSNSLIYLATNLLRFTVRINETVYNKTDLHDFPYSHWEAQIRLIKVNFLDSGVDVETKETRNVCQVFTLPSVHEYSEWRSPRIINMTGKHKMSTPSKLPRCLSTLSRGRDRERGRTMRFPPDSKQTIWRIVASTREYRLIIFLSEIGFSKCV